MKKISIKNILKKILNNKKVKKKTKVLKKKVKKLKTSKVSKDKKILNGF